jgi:hypothetical protein
LHLNGKNREICSIDLLMSKHKARFEKSSNGIVIHKYTGEVELDGNQSVFEMVDFTLCNIQKITLQHTTLNLKKVFLNFCSLTDLTFLKNAPCLSELEAKGNRLSSLASILELSKSVEKLIKLDLRFNEVTLSRNYSHNILSAWPGLQVFDGSAVRNERSAFNRILIIVH